MISMGHVGINWLIQKKCRGMNAHALNSCNFVFQVRTLFVSGLPMDVKPREIYLMFRSFPVSENLF